MPQLIRNCSVALILCLFVANAVSANFYRADDRRFQYTGRIDFKDPSLPRFWAAGVYIVARFSGPHCSISVNDGMQYRSYNYITVAVDGHARRYRLSDKSNVIRLDSGLTKGAHVITICKGTESAQGYIEFVGMNCDKLLDPPARPAKKIEFIGNSITSGSSECVAETPCGQGAWFDQHDAYNSYGPITARALHAQWQLSSVSGIGLIHSCCKMKIVMPQVFDKMLMHYDSLQWNFSRYTPDLVTICLGQNDGVQDSVAFCNAYVDFIKKIRGYYPDADIVCLSSPMADSLLTAAMKNYLTGIVGEVNRSGDRKVHKYFYSRSYHGGCGGHPGEAEHREIADELIAFITKELHWRP